MIQVNRIYLIFNRLVTKKFLVDTSDIDNFQDKLALSIHTKSLKSVNQHAFIPH